jgi:hypothetical protein
MSAPLGLWPPVVSGGSTALRAAGRFARLSPSEAGEPASHDADATEGDRDSHGQQETLLPAEALVSADPQRIGQNGHQHGQHPERDGGVTPPLRVHLSHRVSSLAVAISFIKVDPNGPACPSAAGQRYLSGHRPTAQEISDSRSN